MSPVERRDLRNALVFIAPWIVGFLTFMAYPLLASLVYSFCDYNVLQAPVWVGAFNYTELARDDVFWLSLYNTAISDAGLRHLTGLSKLERLWLAGTKVTDQGAEMLKQALPHCQFFR